VNGTGACQHRVPFSIENADETCHLTELRWTGGWPGCHRAANIDIKFRHLGHAAPESQIATPDCQHSKRETTGQRHGAVEIKEDRARGDMPNRRTLMSCLKGDFQGSVLLIHGAHDGRPHPKRWGVNSHDDSILWDGSARLSNLITSDTDGMRGIHCPFAVVRRLAFRSQFPQ
jgi:hypothetical protein